MRNVFSLILFFTPLLAIGQEYAYVNTDSLILRDRPEKKYNVLAILQPPTKLEIIASDIGYVDNKAVNNKFYQVSFTDWFENGRSYTVHGWVEKKYMVLSRKQITARGADTTKDLIYTNVDIEDPYFYLERNAVMYEKHPVNCAGFPYPRYKGGELHFDKPVKREYFTGPKGGCYYIGPKGRKTYVDSKWCK